MGAAGRGEAAEHFPEVQTAFAVDDPGIDHMRHLTPWRAIRMLELRAHLSLKNSSE